MKINALIKRLERLREKHGNLEVFYDNEVGPIQCEDVEIHSSGTKLTWPRTPEGTKFVLLG